MKKVDFFLKPDPEMAKIYPDYMEDWELRARLSHGIAEYINFLTEKKYTTQEAIRTTARIKKENLSKFLNHDGLVISREAQWRLAYTIISLLPDLVKQEHFKKEFRNQFNAHRTHGFPSEKDFLEAKEGFVKAFGQIGSYLTNDMKDFSKVDRKIEYYYQISNRHS